MRMKSQKKKNFVKGDGGGVIHQVEIRKTEKPKTIR